MVIKFRRCAYGPVFIIDLDVKYNIPIHNTIVPLYTNIVI